MLEHRLNFRTERDSLPTVVGASTLIYVAAATAELRTPAAADLAPWNESISNVSEFGMEAFRKGHGSWPRNGTRRSKSSRN